MQIPPALSTPAVAVPFAMYAGGLLAGAVTDLRSRRIPNLVVAPLLVTGVLYNGYVSGLAGVLHALGGFVLGLGILIIPFSMRLIGGGDVKFLGCVGAWLGYDHMLEVSLWTAALTGVLVVFLLLRHATLRKQVVTNLKSMALLQEVVAVEQRPRSQALPIGVAIASAGLWVALAQRGFPGA